MVIVGCETCGETKVLAGTPDRDGVARVNWTCGKCGTGQVLQIEMSGDSRSVDLKSILGGLALEMHKPRKTAGVRVDPEAFGGL
ncbi:MAG: alcohol dehydrogenase [Synergistaceae bacterium]|jgi:ribosomal protein S27AE|nr:alcohol dehydrogenase [Synergistaceae bacterium]